MSHREREHADGSAERGNDWLDGALAGWLLFIAINGGTLAWHSLRDGADWRTSALNLAVPVLAVAAIFPLLRFHRTGWVLAFGALGLMAAREGMLLAASGGGWRATAVFLAVDLLGLGYLLWIIPEFWPRHAEASPAAPGPAETALSPAPAATSAETAGTPAPATPTPVMNALAAIHHRIVAAGSACAVTEVAVRAEAGRFGVTPAALRTEGLSLYRTFLGHFLADGALSAEEERELICLERALDLDDDGVWRLRAEAGLVGGAAASASRPPPAAVPALGLDSVDEDRGPSAGGAGEPDAEPTAEVAGAEGSLLPPMDAIPAGGDVPAGADAHPALPMATTEPAAGEGPAPVEEPAGGTDGPVPMGTAAADLDPSAQADITSSLPRFQSPRLDAGGSAEPPPPHDPSPGAPIEPAPLAEIIEPIASASPDRLDALADYEEHELRAALAWAGIGALPAGAPRRVALERLRALYRISTEPLEPCATDVALEPGETCLARRDVQVYVAPAGAAPPAPDLPGPVLHRRALVDGTLDGDRDLSALQRRGACRFVLTERRLLLVTPAGQRSELVVSRVRAVLPYRNGIEVRQQRGAPVFLAFSDGVDDAAMRIDRAAADLRARA